MGKLELKIDKRARKVSVTTLCKTLALIVYFAVCIAILWIVIFFSEENYFYFENVLYGNASEIEEYILFAILGIGIVTWTFYYFKLGIWKFFLDKFEEDEKKSC